MTDFELIQMILNVLLLMMTTIATDRLMAIDRSWRLCLPIQGGEEAVRKRHPLLLLL